MKLNKTLWMAASMLFATALVSCDDDKKDPVDPDPIPVVATFTATVDGSIVTIVNSTVGADTYAWDFGDDETSTVKDPTPHTYAEPGDYTITLVASNEDETKTVTKAITINAEGDSPMDILTGGSSKTWVLAPTENSYWFGAADNTDVANKWWGTATETNLARACWYNDEYTFSTDGNYTRDLKGDFWKEYYYFVSCPTDLPKDGCLDLDGVTTLENKLSNDVSAWLNTDFTFAVDGMEITVDGEGGYIGHYTSGRNTSDFGIVEEYKYTIVSITEDQVVISGLGNTGDSNETEECLGYAAGGVPLDGPAHALFTITLVPKAE